MCLTGKSFGQYYKAFFCNLHQHLCQVAKLFVKHFNPNALKKTGPVFKTIVTCLLDTNIKQSNNTRLYF